MAFCSDIRTGSSAILEPAQWATYHYHLKMFLQGVTVSELLALHSYRTNYNNNKMLAYLMKRIYEGEDIISRLKMNDEMALHIVERFKLGKGKYRELKIILRQFVVLPDYSHLSSLRKSFCPELLPYTTENGEIIGVYAKISDCLVSHCLRLIQSGDLVLQDVSNSLVMNVTIGIDGRGDEKEVSED